MVWKCKKCSMVFEDGIIPKEHGYIHIANGHVKRVMCDGEIVEE